MSKIRINGLNLYYGVFQALKDISLDVENGEILAVIGPANSGKSSLLRALNRLHEIDSARVTGGIELDGVSIFKLPINDLRRRVGIIFATPVVLPGRYARTYHTGRGFTASSERPRSMISSSRP